MMNYFSHIACLFFKNRKRNTGKRVAILLKNFDKEVLRSQVMQSLRTAAPSPHALIELSLRDHRRLQDNCIHLKELKIGPSPKQVSYGSIFYGKNIRKRRTTLNCDGKDIITDDLFISTIKKKVILITISKEDAIKLHPHLIISSSTYNSEPSGVVVLLLTTYKPIKDNYKIWTNEDFTKLKKCKPNIIHSSNHHQSSGYYASFGNKGSFDKAIISSVGQYTTKKSTTLVKQLQINKEAHTYERLTANEITRSVNDFSTIIPTIRAVIAPILETTYDLQTTHKDLNMKEGFAAKDGCWQTSLCVNAVTKQYHTEQDCTYTLITVPNQLQDIEKKFTNRYDFIFKINDRQHISLHLTPGTSFIFSGMYLTHRQNMSDVRSHKFFTVF